MANFPWLNIPGYAQPGQPHVFANREQEVNRLYRCLVSAGNAVRLQQPTATFRCVVSGYMGVGKSALLLQTLSMIQSELQVAAGQRLPLPSDLPIPLEPERWIIMRASGKRVASFDSLADDLRKSILEVLADVSTSAKQSTPGAVELPMLHRLLKQDGRLYADVQSQLTILVKTIEYVRHWYGTERHETEVKNEQSERGRSITTDLKSSLTAKGEPMKGLEATAALSAAAGFIAKAGKSVKTQVDLERRVTINADMVVEVLNSFFEATHRAKLPTILLLDDFDEFATHESGSYDERVKVLGTLLRVFSNLKPTCLLFGLRQEYVTDDVKRQYKELLYVPPMSRPAARAALDGWAQWQWREHPVKDLLQLGERFLLLSPERRSVLPFHFLQMVAWLANNGDLERSEHELLSDYLEGAYPSHVVRAIEKLCALMSPTDLEYCFRAEPIAPDAYEKFDRYERLALSREGLLRPASAGNVDDPRLLIDPLLGYYRAASLTVPVTSSASVP